MGAMESNPLPRRKHIRLPADAYYKSATWYFVAICCRNKEPLFQSPKTRDRVKLLLCETATELKVELAAYTILPNHMHLICSSGAKGLPGFIRQFKGRVAAALRTDLSIASPWQARYFDHKIRSEESHKRKCEYVWMNPVRRGLVTKLQDYSWSGNLLTG